MMVYFHIYFIVVTHSYRFPYYQQQQQQQHQQQQP
jgi:hypothetical protein